MFDPNQPTDIDRQPEYTRAYIASSLEHHTAELRKARESNDTWAILYHERKLGALLSRQSQADAPRSGTVLF